VVNSAYDVSGNGGRKLVRLDNGWLVSIARRTDNNYIELFKSKDNGVSWQADGYALSQNAYYSIATDGRFVYIITTRGASFANFFSIDGNVDRGNTLITDAG